MIYYFTSTTNLLYFIVLTFTVLISGFSFLIKNKKSYFVSYLLSIGLLLFIQPVVCFFILNNNDYFFLNEVENKVLDIFSFADLSAILLLGGILATRNIKILNKHLLFTIFCSLFFIFLILNLSYENQDKFIVLMVSISMMIACFCLLLQSLKSYFSEEAGKEFLFALVFVSSLSVIFWLAWFLSNNIIQSNDTSSINFSLIWLTIKSLLIFLLINFVNYIKDEEKNIVLNNLIVETNEETDKLIANKTALFNIPQSIIIIDREKKIDFVSAEAIRVFGNVNLEGKSILDVFITVDNLSSSELILTFRHRDRTLQMFKASLKKFTHNKTFREMLILNSINFDFVKFSSSLIEKSNSNENSIRGILDHNFAIYKMSNSWSRLVGPIDQFFHSGLIWDKLRLITNNHNEIINLENIIASHPSANGWLQIRNGNSLVVSLEKLYAPDYRHFYNFHAKHSISSHDKKK